MSARLNEPRQCVRFLRGLRCVRTPLPSGDLCEVCAELEGREKQREQAQEMKP